MVDLDGNIVRLSEQQVSLAGAMLTRAFCDDPKITHIFPERTAREKLSHYLFEFYLRYAMNYGDVYTTSPSVEGVAVWLPSVYSGVTIWRAFRSGGIGLYLHLGKKIVDSLLSFSTLIDQYHKKHAPFPHYRLLYLGVDPKNQGCGCAGRLIRPMLDWLDLQKMPCYLTTQNEKNVSMYEHYGFMVVEQRTLPHSGIFHTVMLRLPKQAAPGRR